MAHCYKCGSNGPDVQCCSMCHKYMCDGCRANLWMRSADAAYEKLFGYAKDWHPDGRC